MVRATREGGASSIAASSGTGAKAKELFLWSSCPSIVRVGRERQVRDMHKTLIFLSGIALVAAGSQQYVAFDAASASSTYSAGNLAGSPAFAAQQALSGGSGYWCGSSSQLPRDRINVFSAPCRCSSGSQAAGQSTKLRICMGRGVLAFFAWLHTVAPLSQKSLLEFYVPMLPEA